MTLKLSSIIKKKFPDAVSTEIIDEINYLDTGIPSLNYVLSGRPYSGGCPMNGKLTIIYGQEGASKSTLAVSILAEAQKKGYQTLYIDTETSINKQRMQQFGVNIEDDNFTYVTPITMEEVFSIIELITTTKIKEQDDTPLFIVWDSVGATATEEESERDMHSVEMASSAKVLTRSLKKIMPLLHKLPHTACLFINQSRQNMSLYGDTITMTGGQQLKHSATITIRLGKQKAGVDGQICVFSTIKNKCFQPYQKTELHLDYNLGFTKEAKIEAFCEFLKTVGLLKSAGSYCDYSDDLKQIIIDNHYDKKVIEKENEDGTKTAEEGILFDINKKFYMKDFVKKLLDNEDFYINVLKASEDYVQKNIVFVAEQCKDNTIRNDEEGTAVIMETKKMSKKSADEAMAELEESMAELEE